MPNKISVKTERSKDPHRVKLRMSFEFADDDPQAERIYRGLGLMLKEALTPDEAQEFMRQFEVAKKKHAQRKAIVSP